MAKIEGVGSDRISPPDENGVMTYELFDPSGNPLPYFAAEESISKKFRGLAMIRMDLEESESMLKKAIEKDFEKFVEMMWHIAVIGYGRCFVEAKGRGTRLEVSHVREAGDKHLATHKKIMELRHEYVAHSGNNREQIAVPLIPLKGDISNPEIGKPFTFISKKFSPLQQDLEDFLLLVRELKQVVEKLGIKAEKHLIEHYSSKSLEELRYMFGKKV